MPVAGTKLNMLNMTADAFSYLDNKKRVVFRLYLNYDDKMTMAYWQGNDTGFDNDDPVNILDVSGPSSFTWEKGMYFGDQKIGINLVDHIQKKIKDNPTAPYVIFTPTTDHDLSEQIVYAITLSKTNHPIDSNDFVLVGMTKPSPPRNSGRQD